jgi:hypothetical protein
MWVELSRRRIERWTYRQGIGISPGYRRDRACPFSVKDTNEACFTGSMTPARDALLEATTPVTG